MKKFSLNWFPKQRANKNQYYYNKNKKNFRYNKSFRRWVFDKKRGRLILKRRLRRLVNPYFFYIKRQKRIVFKWQRRGKAKKIFSWLKRNKIVKTLKFVLGKKKREFYKNKTKYVFKKKLVFKNFLRLFYGKVTNNAFKKKVKESLCSKKPSVRLLNTLENKLDILLCRSKLAYTRASARYLINQKFIAINYKTVGYHNYVVKPNDIITIQPIVILNFRILNRIFIKKAFKPDNYEVDYNVGAMMLVRPSSFKDLRRSFFINQKIFRTVLQYYR